MPDQTHQTRLLPGSEWVFFWTDGMTIPWIKVEATLPHKPEVMRMAAQLDTSEHAVVGHLVAFWIWCDGNLVGHCPTFSGTVSGIDRVAGCNGFTQAMIDAGWLRHDGKQFEVVHFERHLAQSAKTRAFEAERKRRQRGDRDNVPESPGQRRDNLPKKPGPEKRREEKNNKTDIETRTHARATGDSAAQEPPATPASSVVSDLDGPGEQIIVPERMQHPDVMAAARRWFRHLQQKDPTRVPLPSSPQLQEWWARAGRLGPQRFLEAVSFSVSRGYLNLVEESQNEQHGRTGQQPTKNEQRETNNRNAFAKLLGEDFADAHFSLPFQAGGVLGGAGHDMGDGPQLLPG